MGTELWQVGLCRDDRAVAGARGGPHVLRPVGPPGDDGDRSLYLISKWPAVFTSVAATLVLATTGVLPTVRAEPPDGYYAAAIGESGAALKDALHVIIDGHTPLPYTNPENDDWFDSQDLDVWEALAYTDSACPEDVPVCGKVRLLYLDETRDLVQAYRGGRAGCQDLWEREHVWPTSREFKNQEKDGYTDLHHIRPADKDVNNKHSNYGYNHGGDEVFDKSKGCPNRRASARLSRENQSFEPSDRAKGQVARMLFYMDVRYESGDDVPPESMPDLSLKAGNAKVKEPWIGHLCKLLEWNRRYPPTPFDQRRNDRVMELQGNRNPFIDNPSWADDIWLALPEAASC